MHSSNDVYKKGGSAGIEGSLYEIKLLTLALYRGIKKGWSFKLGSNVENAGKFDDLVFKYFDVLTNKEKSLLLQAKHVLKESDKIKKVDLLTEDDKNYSLIKYYFSFNDDILKNLKKTSFGTVETVRIYTNIDFDDEIKIHVDSIQIDNDILNFQQVNQRKQPMYYQFKKNTEFFKELKEKLENYKQIKLAKTLIDHIFIFKDENRSLRIQKGHIFEDYHAILAQEVIDTKNQKFQFQSKFIKSEGLDSKTQRFREIFEKELEKKSSNFQSLNLNNKIIELTEKKAKEKNESEINKLGKKIKQLEDLEKKRNDKNFKLTLEDINKYVEINTLTIAKTFGKTQQNSNLILEWPTDTVSTDEIKEFLDHLMFAVNQPNESQLDEIIITEIGEEIKFKGLTNELVANHIQQRMLKWFKEKTDDKSYFLTAEEGKGFLDEIKQKINALISIGPSIRYCEELNEFGINFNEEGKNGLKELNNFLMQTIISHLIVSEETLLSAIKVFRALQYQKYDSVRYLFKKLSDLLSPGDTQQGVLNAFNSSYYNLLIIECAHERADITGLYNNLSTILKSDKDNAKKIILISKQDDLLANKFAEYYKDEYESKSDKTSFSDLTENSQESLLKKEVILFQGENISLSKLIDKNNKEQISLIDSETLVKLINSDKDNKIKIGSELPISSGYDKDYYIERTFNRQIEIKSEIFKENANSDLLAISGTDKVSLSILVENGQQINEFDEDDLKNLNRFIFLDNKKAKEQFKELCTQYPGRNIHWLKSESEKFIWQESQGTLSSLIKYRNENNNSENKQMNLKEDHLINNDNLSKIIIISDTAGMGKSTVLTDLANKIKEVDCIPSLWVVRINLNNYSKVLDNEQEERKKQKILSFSGKTAVEFLLNKLLEWDEKSKLTTSLEKELFKHSFKHQNKITVMFDGFDEISPTYKEIVVDLLQSLSKTCVKRLWITTRPNFRKELEERLQVFSYTLEPFSDENKFEFLTKYWKKKLNVLIQESEERLGKYAKTLINKFSKLINAREKEFTCIPLQMRMIAEIFQEKTEGTKEKWQGCKEFIFNNDNTEPRLLEKFNLFILYEDFIKKKFYDFNLLEKKGRDFTKPDEKELADENYKIFKETHEILALHRLLSKDDLTELLLKKEIEQLGSWIQDIKNGKRNQGIIDQIIDNKAHFIHLTFAEYFASFPLVEKFFQDTTLIYINKILANASPVFINSIIKQLDTKKTEMTGLLNGKSLLNLTAKEGYLNFVKALLEAGYDNYPEPDNLNKTPLHYAAEFGHSDIVKYLINYNNDINNDVLERDGSFKNEEYALSKLVTFVNKKDNDDNAAVYYAAKQDKMEIACDLLLKGADSDKLKEYIKQVILYVNEKINYYNANLNDQQLRPILEKLLLHAPETVSHFSIYEYSMLLSYFFQHGRLAVIEALLSSINNEEKRRKFT